MKVKRRQSGLTLTEMAVVVATIALLVGIGLPAVRALLEAHPQATRLALFIDQFEELFALCPEPVQERFLHQ